MIAWQALKETKSLCQRAKKLNSDIDKETEEMKNAVGSADSSLSLINHLSEQIASHSEYLGKEIIEGQRAAKNYVAKSEHIIELETEINTRITMPFFLFKSKMMSSDLTPYHELPKPVIESPDLNFQTSEAIKQPHISSLQVNPEHWDTIAAEFETFEEQFDKAYEFLTETKKTIHKVVQKAAYKEQVSIIKTRKREKESG